MRKKMLKNASFLVIVAVFLVVLSQPSLVMYEKVREAVKGSIRDEAEYVRTLMEAAQGDREPVGTFIWCPPWARRRPTGLRSWIPAGKVLYDSDEDPADHGKSCEPA